MSRNVYKLLSKNMLFCSFLKVFSFLFHTARLHGPKVVEWCVVRGEGKRRSQRIFEREKHNRYKLVIYDMDCVQIIVK